MAAVAALAEGSGFSGSVQSRLREERRQWPHGWRCRSERGWPHDEQVNMNKKLACSGIITMMRYDGSGSWLKWSMDVVNEVLVQVSPT